MKRTISTRIPQQATHLALFILRAGLGMMMFFGHGLPKLQAFAERAESFPDPLGVGSVLSMTLTILAEGLCALLVAFGLFTRWALVPLVITMAIAVLIIHGDDPFSGQESALLYLVPFFALLLTGPGRYSLDQLFFNR
ncbi:MAG: DoxX family protein [Bacteroidota bacterium]|nr:DoxX family protein [Bacteroidota bacterium]